MKVYFHPHALERMKERGANEQLQSEDMGKLLVINEATGEQKELSLAV